MDIFPVEVHKLVRVLSVCDDHVYLSVGICGQIGIDKVRTWGMTGAHVLWHAKKEREEGAREDADACGQMS
jgi:hypothetical protein